jgi:subtilisin family serine protease
MRRLALLAASAGFLAACADGPAPTAVSEPSAAPLLAVGNQDLSLRDRYIVVFKPTVRDVDATVERVARENGIGTVHFRYRSALLGFAATIPSQALEGVRRNPNVEFVEADGLATISGSPQLNPPSWGLDRVDERDLPMDAAYAYQNSGQNVEAYIHVAGTVGGTTTGLAKQVKLIGVRVLNCSGSGSYSGIVAAVDWVTQQKQARPAVPMVGNMSLGGGVSSSLNTAVNNSVDAGVVWAVAAGNDNADACTKSPASAAKALTVGASTSSDARASFSNFGTCVDLFAPGSGIYSSTYDGDNTYASWSGTSMATPHVTGAAALYLSANPAASAASVNGAITGGATQGKVTDPGTGSPNLLLFTLIAGGTVEPPPPPATITVHVGGLTGSATLSGRKFWKASVSALVVDANGAAVPNATVAGSYTSGGSGTCLTAANGRCTITSGNIARSTLTTTFSVSSVSGTNMTYNAGANTPSSILVSRP